MGQMPDESNGVELGKKANKLRKLGFAMEEMREMGKWLLGVGSREDFVLAKENYSLSHAYGHEPVGRGT